MINFLDFQKPQRYIGNEWNVVKKSHYGKIKICLSYPDLYEIGMSNLGLRILYGIFNQDKDVVCERVFLPGNDLLRFLKIKKIKLFSLETKTPLDKFEIIGFNLNYELKFPNILKILSVGGVNIYSNQRKDIIVMGGGIANPEPVADFFDVFFIGEFEDTAQIFIEVLKKYHNKDERLKALSEYEGFYIPSFYKVGYENQKYHWQRTYSYAKFPIKRKIVKDLNNCFYPYNWLTPHTEIIQDRVPVELTRGCPWRCNFCQAKGIYHPYRVRSPEVIEKIIKTVYEKCGYESFSLLSLSANTYPYLKELIERVFGFCQLKRISLSLPSLRVEENILPIYKKLSLLKKLNLTVAAEAGTARLRNILNKRIDLEGFIDLLAILRNFNLRHIKIYFMFGFLEEEDEDLIAIGDFARKLLKETKLKLNISLNIFIPKPFSFWEDKKFITEEEAERKRKIILRSLPHRKSLKISISPFKRSFLEYIISRGNRQTSALIYNFFQLSERENFSEADEISQWAELALQEKKIIKECLKEESKNKPWNFISKGIWVS